MDWANLSVAYFSSLFFLSASSLFFFYSSSYFFFSSFYLYFYFSSSSFFFFSSSSAAKFSYLKPIVYFNATLLAVRSQTSSRCFNYVVLFLPIFLLPMKVPFVLRSVILILFSSLVIWQCFPLNLLSLMQISHYWFLPTRISFFESE